MAIFEFDHQSFIEAFWNAPIRNGRDIVADFLAVLYRERADGPWMIRCRLRWYHDEKVWDSSDTKTAFTITSHFEPTSEAARDDLFAKMEALVATLESSPPDRTCVMVRGDAHAFSSALSRQPFTHVKVGVVGPQDAQ